MPSLVVLDATATPAFVDGLRAAWDAGAAVFPLDSRLPPPARARALAAARPEEPVEDGDALVVATSGTSGAPKAVVLTHEAVRASALAVSTSMEVDPSSDRWLACLPLAHMGGLAVITRALVTGTPLDVHPRFDVAAVDASGATLTSLVPTMADRLDLSRFRVVLVGGGADGRVRPPNVVRTYGMTETGGGIVHDGQPLHGVEVRTDGDGQLHVRGPMLLRGYRDGTDPRDREGWLATGDAGCVVDGRVQVNGRLSNVIVTGGEKVRPEEVELVLEAHPGVKEVAVGGRPDPDWGQRVVAWVVPHHGAAPPTIESLRQAVKESLPPYAAPKELVLVDELPRTPYGKVQRARLSR